MATKKAVKTTGTPAKKTAATKHTRDETTTGAKKAKIPISAEALPRRTLEQAVLLAQKLYEVYAREAASEEEIATALGFTGVTNNFRYQLWALWVTALSPRTRTAVFGFLKQ